MNRRMLFRLLFCLLAAFSAAHLWLHRDLAGQPVSCRLIGPITWDETLTAPCQNVLPPLHTGDVLVTLSSHSLGWRHGHCALVLDESTTLEATTIGQPTTRKRAESWNRYPTLWLLRPKEPLTDSERSALLSAAEELESLPYALVCPKRLPASGAHCAALIWYIYAEAGMNADPDGGRFTFPADLLSSTFFEVLPLR